VIIIIIVDILVPSIRYRLLAPTTGPYIMPKSSACAKGNIHKLFDQPKNSALKS